MDRMARNSLLARAPGALEVGTSEFVNIFVAVEGETLWRENNFLRKKVSQGQKTGRKDPSEFLITQSVVKYQRK